MMIHTFAAREVALLLGPQTDPLMRARQRAARIVWCGVAAVVAGFFLPWVHLELIPSKTVRRPAPPKASKPPPSRSRTHMTDFDRALTDAGRQITFAIRDTVRVPKDITGVMIPKLANAEASNTAMQLGELFTHKREHIGAKSYAVYALPLLAVLVGLLLRTVGDRLPVSLLLAVCCLAVAGVGAWKLLTTHVQSMGMVVKFAIGLWASLAAYVVLAVGAVATGLAERHARCQAMVLTGGPGGSEPSS